VEKSKKGRRGIFRGVRLPLGGLFGCGTLSQMKGKNMAYEKLGNKLGVEGDQ